MPIVVKKTSCHFYLKLLPTSLKMSSAPIVLVYSCIYRPIVVLAFLSVSFLVESSLAANFFLSIYLALIM